MIKFIKNFLWWTFVVIIGLILSGLSMGASLTAAEAPSKMDCTTYEKLEDFAKCEVSQHWDNTQWDSFYILINNESGWDPCAYYPGKSDCTVQPETACGLVQAVPCSKLGEDWTDGRNAVMWGIQYVSDRYGTPQQALQFWGCRWTCTNPHTGKTINKRGKTWY